MTRRLRIDVFADLICPWCFIGKHRLRRAMAQRPGLNAEIHWQPFQLNPAMPRGGMDRTAYLSTKFGGSQRAWQVYRLIEETAARDGLDIRLDLAAKTPNSVLAHRLARFAGRFGETEVMIDTIYGAYFQQGLDIGDVDLLIDLAAARGYDADEANAYLTRADGAQHLRAAEVMARHLGIQAVPYFVFERTYALAGAQEPKAFLPLFDIAQSASFAELAHSDFV